MNTEREHNEQQTEQSRWGFRGMTVRDWLELLIVPVVLALITVVFTWQQNERQQDLETKRTNQAQKIENQRAETERELAKQQQQYDAVQEYMDKMTDLILSDREGGLRSSKEGSDLRKLARARTLTVVLALNGERKRIIVTFLHEARLLEAPNPVVDIGGASLEDAHLQRNPYVGVDLQGTYLNDGSDKDLKGALLRKCDLRDADLSDAEGVTNEQLRATGSLREATMPDGQTLKSAANPDGPTFEDWLKDKKAQGNDEKNE